MTWIEEVSYNYWGNEHFFIDLPAIFEYCLPALISEFIRLCISQFIVNALYQLIISDTIIKGRHVGKSILAAVLGSLVLIYFYSAKAVLCLNTVLIIVYFLIKDRRLESFIASLILTAGWTFGVCEMNLRSMQGPLMILAMKIFTVITRKSSDEKSPDGLPLFLHYCLSPSSTVFGPIVQFEDFKAKVFSNKFSLPLKVLLRTILATFLTFITANCICQSVEWVSTSTDAIQPYHIRFLKGYKHALEFRMSHYFICYLSTFQMNVGNPKLASPIVDFWAIEAPESIREVVRSWNKPMHSFLKTHVFLKIRTSLGGAAAVVLTFLVSAALHMFEIRVTVVLFGLAIVSLIETRLEKHLSRSLSKVWFRITTFIHLAFLGMIMMGPEEEDDPFMPFAMEKWMELGFISFKILIIESVLVVAFEVRKLWKQ